MGDQNILPKLPALVTRQFLRARAHDPIRRAHILLFLPAIAKPESNVSKFGNSESSEQIFARISASYPPIETLVMSDWRRIDSPLLLKLALQHLAVVFHALGLVVLGFEGL